MSSIVEDTDKFVEKLSEKSGGLFGMVKGFKDATKNNEKITKLRERLITLSQAATYLALVKEQSILHTPVCFVAHTEP